jgi:repressor LexA
MREECRTGQGMTSPRSGKIDDPRGEGTMAADYTCLQGQYLAFIYYYTMIHRIPPAEADMRRYFRVTPPSVHEMVKTLERRGFISREPGKPRTIRVLLSRAELPDLEPIDGPPW